MNLDFEVNVAGPHDLGGALRLLEGALRDGEPVSASFGGLMRRAMEGGGIEVLLAVNGERVLGVLVLAYRPNVAAGGEFASVEDLYVEPEHRRRGVGRALMEAAAGRCAERGVSYVEVQVEEEAARRFYAALGYEPEPDVRVMSRSYVL